jgi:hypothetical protein
MSPLYTRRSTGTAFLGLFALGMIGVLSLPLSLVPILERQVAHTGAAAASRNALALMTVVQPTLLLTLGVALGCIFAPRVGLVSLLERSRPLSRLRRCASIAIACGFTLAIVFTLADVFFFRNQLDESTVAALEQGGLESTLTAILYGGITEEIITRWGLVSFFAWLGWRVFQPKRTHVSDSIFVTAIVLAALVFALAQLPVTMKIAAVSAPLLARVLVLNSVAGGAFGWLFWRHNLETAMLAHASVHLGLAALATVGLA